MRERAREDGTAERTEGAAARSVTKGGELALARAYDGEGERK